MHINTFEHITISTGHTNQSRRNEITDDIVIFMKDWFNTSIPRSNPEGADISLINDIPYCPGFCAIFKPINDSLLVTIIHIDHITHIGTPCITFGISENTLNGKYVWEFLHGDQPQTFPTRTDKNTQPKTPWCAARFDEGFNALSVEDSMWMGDFERCVTWMWFELIYSKSGEKTC